MDGPRVKEGKFDLIASDGQRKVSPDKLELKDSEHEQYTGPETLICGAAHMSVHIPASSQGMEGPPPV
jgi:hypothetical protein